MEYQRLMSALDMVWDEKPRLDVRACRDEAYSLLDRVLRDFTDYTWTALNEELTDMLDNLTEDDIEVIGDAVSESVSFGLDLYLGCVLASDGKLTSSGRKAAQTEKVFQALEQTELHTEIIERYDLVPVILRDYAGDILDSLAEEIEDLGLSPWNQVDSLRQLLLNAATTSFIFTAVHLGNLYQAKAGKN